jgi:hypothetical protein
MAGAPLGGTQPVTALSLLIDKVMDEHLESLRLIVDTGNTICPQMCVQIPMKAVHRFTTDAATDQATFPA